jgi:hypothetical protein
MIYLYLKTHNVTGLKYLGKTISEDPYAYTGSGVYWKKHINKHGYDCTTEILAQSEDPLEIRKLGLEYSDKLNIVESKEFANLKEECGDGGWDHINNNKDFYVEKSKKIWENLDEDIKKEINAKKVRYGKSNGMYGSSRQGEENPMFGKTQSQKTREKISKAKIGKFASDESKEKMSLSHKEYWKNEKLRKKRSEEYKMKGIRPPSHKGLFWWTDGKTSIRALECPGKEWKRGRK